MLAVKRTERERMLLQKGLFGWLTALALPLAVAASGCGTTSPTAVGPSTGHHHASATPKAKAPPKKAKPVARPGVVQPTPKHPLNILVIGDSLGEDLMYGMEDIVGNSKVIHIIPKAVGSTGLVNTSYYNWRATLNQDLNRYHPGLVVVLLGGNDALSFYQGGKVVDFGSPLWHKDYGGRVAALMTEAQRHHVPMVWVGLPIMGPNAVLSNHSMMLENSLYAAEARKHPGTAFVPSWKVFQEGGHYVTSMTDNQGVSVLVRDPDGVHIALPAGGELIASWTLWNIERIEHISICINGSNLWNTYPLHACGVKPAG